MIVSEIIYVEVNFIFKKGFLNKMELRCICGFDLNFAIQGQFGHNGIR